MSEVDPYVPRTPPTTCEPIYADDELQRRRPGVWAFREAWIKRWGGRSLGVARSCGKGSASAHHESRAWDWGPSAGQSLEAWQDIAIEAVNRLSDNDDELARRLGLRNIIFDRLIWTADGKQWRPYGGPDPHDTHVHFDWGWDGALAKTSGYEGGALAVPLVLRATPIALATVVLLVMTARS